MQECYAEDCQAYPMGLGVIEGRKGLQKVEDAVLAKAPQRHLDILRTHIAGDTACVGLVGAQAWPDNIDLVPSIVPTGSAEF